MKPWRSLICALVAAWIGLSASSALADYDADMREVTSLLTSSQPERALAILDRVVADRTLPPSKLAYALRRRGNALDNLKRRPEAIADYDLSLRLDPRSAAGHFMRGRAHFNAGDYAAALADGERSVKLDADDERAFELIGDANLMLGRADRALDAYRRAIALDRRSASAHAGAGEALIRLGRPGDAHELLTRAIDALGPTRDLLNERAVALMQLDRPAEAAGDLREILTLLPRDARANSNLGAALRMMGDHAGARRHLDIAIAADPANADAWNNRGVARAAAGDRRGAIDDFTEALRRLGRPSPPTLLSRALAYARLGEAGRALADMEAAERLAPDNAEVLTHRCIVHAYTDDSAAMRAVARRMDERRLTVAAYVCRALVADFDGARREADALWRSAMDGLPRQRDRRELEEIRAELNKR